MFSSSVFEDCDWASEECDFGKSKGCDTVIKDAIEDGVAFTTTEIEPCDCAEEVDSAEDC